MTKNDKSDLKVPRFDGLNKALSRDTRIKVWTQAMKRASLSRFGMKGTALFSGALQHQAGQDLAYAAFCSSKENCQGCSGLLQDGARE